MIEIADTTGIGRITLSRMLQLGAVVETDTLDKLCELLECRLEDLADMREDTAALPIVGRPSGAED